MATTIYNTPIVISATEDETIAETTTLDESTTMDSTAEESSSSNVSEETSEQVQENIEQPSPVESEIVPTVTPEEIITTVEPTAVPSEQPVETLPTEVVATETPVATQLTEETGVSTELPVETLFPDLSEDDRLLSEEESLLTANPTEVVNQTITITLDNAKPICRDGHDIGDGHGDSGFGKDVPTFTIKAVENVPFQLNESTLQPILFTQGVNMDGIFAEVEWMFSYAEVNNESRDYIYAFLIKDGELYYTKDLNWTETLDWIPYKTSDYSTSVSFRFNSDRTAQSIHNIEYKGGDGAIGSPEIARPVEVNIKSYPHEITIGGSGTLAKDGYSFVGWEYAGKIFKPGDTFTISEAYPPTITFVAKWEKNHEYYTVKYMDGKNSFPDIVEEKNNVNEQYIVKGVLGQEGNHEGSGKHTLYGWVTEDALSDKSLKLNDKGNFIINDKEDLENIKNSKYFRTIGNNYNGTKSKGVIKLYAIWAVSSIVNDQITITYVANGGIGDNVEVTQKEGDNHLVKENSFKRGGYKFINWNTKSDGNGTTYKVGETISDLNQNITLFAMWQKDESKINDVYVYLKRLCHNKWLIFDEK